MKIPFTPRLVIIVLCSLLVSSISAQNWVDVEKFLPPRDSISPYGGQGDETGRSVDIDGATAVIGSPGADFNGLQSGMAMVMERVGSTWSLDTALLASDGQSYDGLGVSVAIDGTRVVVGAIDADPLGSSSGSVYVFDKIAGLWSQSAKLTASDGAAGDLFGFDVDVDGDIIIVSAKDETANGGTQAGAAYIFELTGGTWSQTAKLLASDGASLDIYGFSVALDDTIAVCGAPSQSNPLLRQGAAYVYSRDGGAWAQLAKLTAPDAGIGDAFGIAVAADADRILVGVRADADGGSVAGSAYFYERIAGVYTFEQKVLSSDIQAGDQFGWAVDIEGTRAVIGARFEDAVGYRSGSAYVFDHAATWTQTSKLVAADAAAEDWFGFDVALSGDYILSGARFDDESGYDSGSAYVYNLSGTWSQQQKILENDSLDDPSNDAYGSAVDLSWDNAVMGSSNDGDFGPLSGSVTFAAFDGSEWQNLGKVYASDATTSLNFGWSVSISGSRAAVGAYGDKTKGSFAGAVYLFEKVGNQWVEVQKLVAPDGQAYDNFGWSVKLQDDELLIGAYLDDDGGVSTGSVYYYAHNGSQWVLQSKIAPTVPVVGRRFGFAIDMHEDMAVISARDDDAQATNNGTAFVFRKIAGVWTQEGGQLTINDPSSNKTLGQSVCTNGEYVFAGAPSDAVGFSTSGAVYVFTQVAGVWSQVDKHKAAIPAQSQFYGYSVDCTPDYMIAGAYRGLNSYGEHGGFADVFEHNGTDWAVVENIANQESNFSDYFGHAVAIDGSSALIGSQYDDDNGQNCGSAFVYSDCLDDNADGICDFEQFISINNVCDSAYAIIPSTFGTPGWDTLSFLGASGSIAGCIGDADDDIWFSFIAGDANDVVHAQDPAGVSNIVIEVFDGCAGQSLGCFDNYPAGEIERAIPGDLVSGQEYIYRVYDAATGPSSSTDVRTQVKTFASGALRAQYCGRTDYSLSDYVTPERQDLYELYPYTQTLVSGYELSFVDQSNSDETSLAQTGYGSQFFQLSDVPALEFNKSYAVSARHAILLLANGDTALYWSDYGSSCMIATAGPIPTRIRDQFCSQGSFQINEYIQSYHVPNADLYRFRLAGSSHVLTKNAPSYTLFLSQVVGLTMGDTYSVTVEARVNGTWSQPGAACDITILGAAPSVGLQSQYCDSIYIFPSSQYMLADQVVGAQRYEWRFLPDAGGATLYAQTTGLSIAFHTCGLQFLPGGSYDVSVRVKLGGVWGDFSSVCPISFETREEGVVQEAFTLNKSMVNNGAGDIRIWPNPMSGTSIVISANGFERKEARTAQIVLLSASGQEVYAEQISVKGTDIAVELNLPERMASGLYLVKLSDGNEERTTRLSVN